MPALSSVQKPALFRALLRLCTLLGLGALFLALRATSAPERFAHQHAALILLASALLLMPIARLQGDRRRGLAWALLTAAAAMIAVVFMFYWLA